MKIVTSILGRKAEDFVRFSWFPSLTLCPPLSLCRYAFGITLWEMYTSARPFAGVPQALLGHAIACGRRPEFPPDTPQGFADLAEWCWGASAEQRPTFKAILEALTLLLRRDSGVTKRIRVSYTPRLFHILVVIVTAARRCFNLCTRTLLCQVTVKKQQQTSSNILPIPEAEADTPACTGCDDEPALILTPADGTYSSFCLDRDTAVPTTPPVPPVAAEANWSDLGSAVFIASADRTYASFVPLNASVPLSAREQ